VAKKKKVVAVLIALVAITCFLTVSVLSEDVNSHNLIICAFDQNPAGSDGTEWVGLYNPTTDTIDLSNWRLTTKHGGGNTVSISEGAELIPEGIG